jgi:hypothetical protein
VALIGASWAAVGTLFAAVNGPGQPLFLDASGRVLAADDFLDSITGAGWAYQPDHILGLGGGAGLIAAGLLGIAVGVGALLGQDWGRLGSLIYAFACGALSVSVTVGVLAGAVVADPLGSIGIFGAQSVLFGFAFVVLLRRWRPRAPA